MGCQEVAVGKVRSPTPLEVGLRTLRFFFPTQMQPEISLTPGTFYWSPVDFHSVSLGKEGLPTPALLTKCFGPQKKCFEQKVPSRCVDR